MKRSAVQICEEVGIELRRYEPGRYYTQCPNCKKFAKHATNRKRKSLGVTIDDRGVFWGCNNCQVEHGGKFFDGTTLEPQGGRMVRGAGDRSLDGNKLRDLHRQTRAAWRR